MSCPTQHVVTPCHTMLWHVLSYTCVAVCCSELQMSSWHSYETCVGQDMSQHVVTPVDSHIRDIRMCDMSHVRMSHVTHINESCHTYEWVMSHIWRIRDTHMKESCYMYEGVTNSCHVTWMKESRHVTTCRDSSQCVAVCCSELQMSSWHFDVSDTTQESRHVTTCHTYKSVMSHVWHVHMCHTYEWVMSHIWMSVLTPSYMSHL